MLTKRAYSRKLVDGDSKVSFSAIKEFRIETPQGDSFNFTIAETQSLMAQIQDLFDSGAAIPLRCMKSSNIEAIGYSKKNQVLRVKFKNGGSYDYEDVPEDIYKEALESESIGHFFHVNIRQKFSYVKYESNNSNVQEMQ